MNEIAAPGFPVFNLRSPAYEFSDLPWQLPLVDWPGVCTRLEMVERGVSRHQVVFVNYAGNLIAIKELPPGLAEREYQLLLRLEEHRLPAVSPIGWTATYTRLGRASILITRYLDHSLPFRNLFQRGSLDRYQASLLDSIAGLLVQLHLAGFYWGDCSLSNTLFRRDDGALEAYLVDLETGEFFDGKVPPVHRFQDLQIMEENINGDIADLRLEYQLPESLQRSDIGAYISARYSHLWIEITREIVILTNERYRIQERIRALNDLGFSVGEVELSPTTNGDQLRIRVVVTDRNFHRDQLQSLTGLDVEEMQARKMMNEIQELKATLSQVNNRSTSLSVAAYHWMDTLYLPISRRLEPLVTSALSLAELYCQVLEHKWYLSEQARHDVGHQVATDDYLARFTTPGG